MVIPVHKGCSIKHSKSVVAVFSCGSRKFGVLVTVTIQVDQGRTRNHNKWRIEKPRPSTADSTEDVPSCFHFRACKLSSSMLQDAVLGLLAEAMITSVTTSKGFLIDGYPRELEQGLTFEAQVSNGNRLIALNVRQNVRRGIKVS
jgi:hypothetical protein